MASALDRATAAARRTVKSSPRVRAAAFLVQNARRSIGSVGARTSSSEPRYRLGAMVRVKDEARFLPEWLAYHVSLGVEHCVIYDNNSSDDIESVMQPFVDRGLATYVHWPTVPASPSSHEHFLREFGSRSRWVAFLDADEFVIEREPGALDRVLVRHDDRPAVAISSRYFGSAGHERIPRGLVLEQFDRAAPEPSEHVKVIARPDEVAGYRNPHNFYYRGGRLARTPDGRRVFGSFVQPDTHPELVLHHYVYRSREDYENKATRGYSTAAGAKANIRRTSRAGSEFERHNEVQVVVPLALLQATARMLRDLAYPTDLFEAGAREHHSA